MKAMILAAGLGKRMLPLTATTPKPLLTVNGKALIDYHLEALVAAGFGECVINHAYLGEQVEAHCGTGDRYGITIHYSRENEPLNTAGGIANALALLGDEPFAVINGDIWTDYDFSRLQKKAISNSLAHLILVDNPEHNSSGDFALSTSGHIVNQTENLLTYTGIAVMTKALFNRYAYYHGPLAPLLRQAMTDHVLTGERYTGQWFDVGTPQRLQSVSEFVRKIA